MRFPIGFFLLLILIFINFNCDTKTGPGGQKPLSVHMIAAVDDTCVVETGIDAIPDGNSIRLEWASADDETIDRLEVFRASVRQGPYSKIATLEGSALNHEDDGPSVQVRYYYYLLSVNGDGLRSDPSDTVDYKLIPKARDLAPQGLCERRPMLHWRDANYANDYIVRVRENGGGPMVWLSKVQSSFGSEDQAVVYNADGGASLDSLIVGRYYEWRVDVVGNESDCGSESPWATIQIQ